MNINILVQCYIFCKGGRENTKEKKNTSKEPKEIQSIVWEFQCSTLNEGLG